MSRIERKLLAHMIKAKPPFAEPVIVRLGDDLEEYTVELNPQTDEIENILNEVKFDVSGYRPQASVEPYYAEPGTALHAYLEDIVRNRRVHDDLVTDAYDVELWNAVGEKTYVAYRETVTVVPKSHGGNTKGVQIPFEVHYKNDPVKGTYNAVTKTFTPDSGTLGALLIELVAGADSTHTKVSDVIGEGSGTLKYKVGASVPQPAYGDSATGYSDLTLNTGISCEDGNVLRVVEVANSVIVATSGAYPVIVGEGE